MSKILNRIQQSLIIQENNFIEGQFIKNSVYQKLMLRGKWQNID